MDMKNIAEFAKKILALLEKVFKFCFKSFEKAEIQFDFGQALFLIVIFLVTFGSACSAYSIARARHRKAWGFFLLGFFVPVITPLLMLLLLSTELELNDIRRRKQKALEAEAEKNSIMGQKKLQEEAAREAAEKQNASPWNADHFRKIYRRQDGTPAGPWNVTYGSATVIVAEILEILDEVLVVHMVGKDGSRIKMRIPFARIEKWDERTEPVPEAPAE